MSSSARFVLFVKASSDGKTLGDCPFSQRCNMYSSMKIPAGQIELSPIDLSNKTPEFLQLNPEGKVPVLIDRGDDNKVVADSSEINKYIDQLFPEPDLQQNYSGPGVEATAGVFSKFAAFMKNKDPSLTDSLRQALVEELQKVENFLSSPDHTSKYLLCDQICEMDCMLLPRLRHVQVGGKHYRQFEIPVAFTKLHDYIKRGEENEVFRRTCPADKEIIIGWGRHM